MDKTYKVAAMYRFTPVSDIQATREKIYAFTDKNAPSMCGTLLLAPEGINGTIAAHPHEMDKMIAFLDREFGIIKSDTATELKYSHATKQPFNRFKVRPKKELITLRKPEANPSEHVGESSPHGYVMSCPSPRAAYSHSASVGRRAPTHAAKYIN